MITIIILLILAGITISQLTGSGLFENAKLAEQKSKNAQEKEEGILSDYDNKIGKYVDASRDTVTLTIEQYNNIINRLTSLENKKPELDYDNAISIGSYLDTVNDVYTFEQNGYIIVQMGIDAGGYYYSTIKHNSANINCVRFHNAASGGAQYTDHTIVNAGDQITVTHINKIQGGQPGITFIPFK